jgi:hypothetical protein
MDRIEGKEKKSQIIELLGINERDHRNHLKDFMHLVDTQSEGDDIETYSEMEIQIKTGDGFVRTRFRPQFSYPDQSNKEEFMVSVYTPDSIISEVQKQKLEEIASGLRGILGVPVKLTGIS